MVIVSAAVSCEGLETGQLLRSSSSQTTSRRLHARIRAADKPRILNALSRGMTRDARRIARNTLLLFAALGMRERSRLGRARRTTVRRDAAAEPRAHRGRRNPEIDGKGRVSAAHDLSPQAVVVGGSSRTNRHSASQRGPSRTPVPTASAGCRPADDPARLRPTYALDSPTIPPVLQLHVPDVGRSWFAAVNGVHDDLSWRAERFGSGRGLSGPLAQHRAVRPHCATFTIVACMSAITLYSEPVPWNARTSPAHTVSDFPAFFTVPIARNLSPSAGRMKLILNSAVTTSNPGGAFVRAA